MLYTLYIVHCTLYTVHCTLYTVHCTLYTVNTVNAVHSNYIDPIYSHDIQTVHAVPPHAVHTVHSEQPVHQHVLHQNTVHHVNSGMLYTLYTVRACCTPYTLACCTQCTLACCTLYTEEGFAPFKQCHAVHCTGMHGSELCTLACCTLCKLYTL